MGNKSFRFLRDEFIKVVFQNGGRTEFNLEWDIFVKTLENINFDDHV